MPESRRELRSGVGSQLDSRLTLVLASDMKSQMESQADYVYSALTEALFVVRSRQDERINHHTWFYLLIFVMIASDVFICSFKSRKHRRHPEGICARKQRVQREILTQSFIAVRGCAVRKSSGAEEPPTKGNRKRKKREHR
jgi:hypothetical protein